MGVLHHHGAHGNLIPLPLLAKPNKHHFEFIAEEGDAGKGKNDIQRKGQEDGK